MTSNSIRHIDRTLSDATSPVQRGSRSYGNERVLCVSQSFSLPEATTSDCLVSYPGDSLLGGESYSYIEMHSVYSTVLVDWAMYVSVCS